MTEARSEPDTLIFLSHHPRARTGGHFRFDRLARSAAPRGYRSIWVTPPREDDIAPQTSATDVLWLRLPRWVPGKPLRAALAVFRQRRALRRLAGARARVVTFSETTYPAALVAARLLGCPLSVSVRANHPKCHQVRQSFRRNPVNRLYNGLRFWLASRLWRAAFDYADQIIVPSPAAGEDLTRVFRTPPARIITIENDVPRPPDDGQRRQLPERPRRALFIGSRTPLKGLDILSEACRRLPAECPLEQLTIIGVAPKHARARFAGNDRIAIEAWQRRSDIFAVLAEHDLVIIPSRTDQFPNVLLEATACGVPVIGTDRDGIRHALRDPAVLFEPQADDLVACLQRTGTPEGYRHAQSVIREVRERLSFDWEARFLQTLTAPPAPEQPAAQRK